MGRPSMYTPEVVAKICEGIRLGLTYELAAQYGGIAGPTFYRWQKDIREFREAVGAANAHAAAVNMARINAEAQQGEWRAAAWIMEHRFPEHYNRQIHEYTGNEEKPLKVVIERVDRAARAEGQDGKLSST